MTKENIINPNISMHILHTVLYTFVKCVLRGTHLTIKLASLIGYHFVYSCDFYLGFCGDVLTL